LTYKLQLSGVDPCLGLMHPPMLITMPSKGGRIGPSDRPIILSATIGFFNHCKVKHILTKDSNNTVRILVANKVGLICRLGTDCRMVAPPPSPSSQTAFITDQRDGLRRFVSAIISPVPIAGEVGGSLNKGARLDC
jgi:hypothetical protein